MIDRGGRCSKKSVKLVLPFYQTHSSTTPLQTSRAGGGYRESSTSKLGAAVASEGEHGERSLSRIPAKGGTQIKECFGQCCH